MAAMCRRLHGLPHEANKDNHGAAARVAAASGQAQHEAEIAALALAILVRLTSHAGAVGAPFQSLIRGVVSTAPGHAHHHFFYRLHMSL